MDNGVIWIGERKKSIGRFREPIPYTGLSSVIHVDLLVLAEAIPKLLSTKNIMMMENDLDVSLTHKCISYQGRHHPLSL